MRGSLTHYSTCSSARKNISKPKIRSTSSIHKSIVIFESNSPYMIFNGHLTIKLISIWRDERACDYVSIVHWHGIAKSERKQLAMSIRHSREQKLAAYRFRRQDVSLTVRSNQSNLTKPKIRVRRMDLSPVSISIILRLKWEWTGAHFVNAYIPMLRK